MSDTTGRGQAALLEGETEFDGRDAALLRAIQQTGSVAGAATELGRSRARALKRLETLEETFGTLVERQRGGSGGGGSQLTATGRRVLDRYDRLAAALSATASVPETVLSGTVSAVDGEMATVQTAVGRLCGLHDGVGVGDSVDVRIGADAITVYAPDTVPEPDATSARNRLSGTVSGVESGETVLTVSIEVTETQFLALVTADSARRLGLAESAEVTLTWKATATQLVPSSPADETGRSDV